MYMDIFFKHHLSDVDLFLFYLFGLIISKGYYNFHLCRVIAKHHISNGEYSKYVYESTR